MNNTHGAVPLYFITGFLGSGKTTLLNRALEEAAEKGLRLGVIINEWGQVSIDSGLVSTTMQTGAPEIEVRELNNGQVFCSCLTADFIHALELFARRDLDAVIVETSGMANPFPLKKLLADLAEKTGERYKYAFMTALIDPENFLELLGVINAVDEQVSASQRVIINKIDLATPQQVAEVQAKTEAINPDAEIFKTVNAQIPDFFAQPKRRLSPKKAMLAAFVPANTNYPRPGNYVLATPEKLEINAVMEFMADILPHALRVKGIIQSPDDKWHYVDGVNARVVERLLSGERTGGGKIVIIPKGGQDIRELVQNCFASKCGNKYSLT